VIIDEHTELEIPKTIRNASTTRRAAWIRRSILRYIWDVRNTYLMQGFDIFGVAISPDRVEIDIHGDVRVTRVPDEKIYSVRWTVKSRKRNKHK